LNIGIAADDVSLHVLDGVSAHPCQSITVGIKPSTIFISDMQCEILLITGNDYSIVCDLWCVQKDYVEQYI